MREVTIDDVQFFEMDLSEVLDTDHATPPKRVFWDFLPQRLLSFLRRHFNGWPRVTPYQKWLVTLMVKLTVLYSDAEKNRKKRVTKNEEYFYHYSPMPKRDDGKNWN